ncbi:WecB/TagA/CpsF family glycosyltransferase [Rubritalea profundi]|uniref:WecB/TagA/CpsF family glycosyltransferase n=1 Tax=Rubritalea profundi TaxID=1658618 RepID=UPI000CF3E1B4
MCLLLAEELKSQKRSERFIVPVLKPEHCSLKTSPAFHAGEIPQAPGLFQKFGMEWLYRLCKEPRRLFRRYFTYNSLFVYYSLNN